MEIVGSNPTWGTRRKTMVYCDWDGFVWVWDFDSGEWLIDLEKSGGPPSPHDPSPSNPPFVVAPRV